MGDFLIVMSKICQSKNCQRKIPIGEKKCDICKRKEVNILKNTKNLFENLLPIIPFIKNFRK